MKKISNAIVVGGPIAVGKSSLVGSLPFIPVQELDPNDELQRVLIQKMYEGDDIAPQIFQLDIMLQRHDKYLNLANADDVHVFDRSIFEDRLFAKILLEKKKNIWNYYHSIWKDKIKEVMEEIGKPRFYILLTCDFPTFKDRIFARNRTAEIENFGTNEPYFKNLLDIYQGYMNEIFEEYGIEHIVVDTSQMGKLEVIEFVQKELAKRGIK